MGDWLIGNEVSLELRAISLARISADGFSVSGLCFFEPRKVTKIHERSARQFFVFSFAVLPAKGR